MHYRKFGKSDYESSILGFGAMRFPLAGGPGSNQTEIDEVEAIKMIRYSIDHGVNYIDTAYPYHGGKSEGLVAKALKDGYREKVKVATKLPTWLINSYEDCEKYLDEQLARLEMDYVDYYLMHAMNKDRWSKMLEVDGLSFLKEALKKGKIKNTGFSFHEDIRFFRTILDAFEWDMCQVQFNYMESSEWVEEIQYAASKGVAVVVMEPLLGGKLASRIPSDIQQIWNEAEQRKDPVEWAFRWIADHPEVKLILSGMSTMDQVIQNVDLCDRCLPESLSRNDKETINRVREAYTKKLKIKCTACEYCMPCPQGVVIPTLLSLYNNVHMYNTLEESKGFYSRIVQGKKDASLCVECGICEDQCPQKLEIIKSLKDVDVKLR